MDKQLARICEQAQASRPVPASPLACAFEEESKLGCGLALRTGQSYGTACVLESIDEWCKRIAGILTLGISELLQLG